MTAARYTFSLMRITDFKKGDRVKLIVPVHDHSWGSTVLPIGTTGTLERLYRIQEGIECWSMWLDKAVGLKHLLGVGHDAVERIAPKSEAA